MKYFGDDGEVYILTDKFAEGTTSCIYKVQGLSMKLAKIYKKNNILYDIKTELLCRIPTDDKIRKYIAIPEILLYHDRERKLQAGFIMEKFDFLYTMDDIYNNKCPLSIKAKAVIAKNLCDIVEVVHNHKDIVLENIKHSFINCGEVKITEITLANFNKYNICIGIINNEDFDIKIVDADCLQLKLSLHTGEKYISSKVFNLKSIDVFTKYTDCYCLASHLHILLLDTYPFFHISDSGSSRDMSISQHSSYPYANLSDKFHLPNYVPDFNIITPELQSLFIRTFAEGTLDPTKIPTPKEFKDALEKYIAGLKPCKCGNLRHYGYKKGYTKKNCEWCRIERIKNIHYADSNFIFDYNDKIVIIF